jgi:hypothetical protein
MDNELLINKWGNYGANIVFFHLTPYFLHIIFNFLLFIWIYPCFLRGKRVIFTFLLNTLKKVMPGSFLRSVPFRGVPGIDPVRKVRFLKGYMNMGNLVNMHCYCPGIAGSG